MFFGRVKPGCVWPTVCFGDTLWRHSQCSLKDDIYHKQREALRRYGAKWWKLGVCVCVKLLCIITGGQVNGTTAGLDPTWTRTKERKRKIEFWVMVHLLLFRMYSWSSSVCVCVCMCVQVELLNQIPESWLFRVPSITTILVRQTLWGPHSSVGPMLSKGLKYSKTGKEALHNSNCLFWEMQTVGKWLKYSSIQQIHVLLNYHCNLSTVCQQSIT